MDRDRGIYCAASGSYIGARQENSREIGDEILREFRGLVHT
ncbi:hypothetical protein [Eisenbergiella sp.]